MYTRIETVDGQEVATHNLPRPTRIGNTFIGKKESDLTKYGYYEEDAPPPDDTQYQTHQATDYAIVNGKASLTYTAVSKPVPKAISALQAFLAMDDLGYLATYDAWVADPSTTRRDKMMAEKAQTWRRDSAFFNAVATALGITEADRDAFFIHAGSLDL